MIRTIPATEAKTRFGKMVKQVYATGEHLVIERNGIAVAAIIPITDYERLHLRSRSTPPELARQVHLASNMELAHRQLGKIPTVRTTEKMETENR